MDDTISLGENSVLVNEAKSSCREFNSFVLGLELGVN